MFSDDVDLDTIYSEPTEAPSVHIHPRQPQSYYLAEHKDKLTAKEKVTELRDVVFRGRLRLKEKRNELREERLAYNKIEAKLVGSLRHVLKEGSPSKKAELDKLYTELQSLRDNLGILQYDYDQAEDEFDGVEVDLDEAELMIRSPITSPSDAIDYESDRPDVVKEDTFLFEGKSPAHNIPLPEQKILEEYQSRIGDMNILREQLEDILHEHSRRNITSHARNSIGPTDGSWAAQDIENQRPLQSVRDSKAKYSQIMHKLNLVEEDVKILRERAATVGHYIEEQYWPDMPSAISSSNSTPKQRRAESITHTHQSDSAIPYLRKNFRIARARINKWIFDRLQSSPIEHTRHKTTLQALQARSMNDETWACLVLEFWRTDDLAADIDSDTWEFISANNTHGEDKCAALVLPEASQVLQAFDSQFAAIRKMESKPRVSDVSSFKRRDSPYMEKLEMDTESQYESRSI